MYHEQFVLDCCNFIPKSATTLPLTFKKNRYAEEYKYVYQQLMFSIAVSIKVVGEDLTEQISRETIFLLKLIWDILTKV